MDSHISNIIRLQELSRDFQTRMKDKYYSRFLPHGKELNMMLLSYIPKDGHLEDNKKFSFISEMLTIKKSLHTANTIFSLNGVFACLLYFKVNLTSRRKLIGLGSLILSSNLLIHMLIENRFALVLNEVFSDDLRYTLYKLQSNSHWPSELSTARKEITSGISRQVDKPDQKPLTQEKLTIVDFLIDGFYAPVDEKVENTLYLTNNPNYSRQSFLDIVSSKYIDKEIPNSKGIGIKLNSSSSNKQAKI